MLRENKCNYLLLAKSKELIWADTINLLKHIKKVDSLVSAEDVLSSKEYKYSYFKKMSDSLTTLNDSLTKIRSFHKLYRLKRLDEMIADSIAKFSVRNIESTGNLIKWFDVDGSYQLKNNSIFDSTLFSSLKISQKQFHKFTLGASLNWLRNTKFSLFYFNFGIKISNSYALEGKTIEDIHITDTIRDYTFRAYDNTRKTNLNITYFSMAPFFNLVLFPGQQKELGIETGLSISNQEFTAKQQLVFSFL
jgi:hypothetical protein